MREAKQEQGQAGLAEMSGQETAGSTSADQQVKPARKRLSRYQRSENAPSMIMMERDKQVVTAVWEHRFLRRDQIERLFFTQTSACNKRLMRLFQYGYLERIFKPVVFGGCQAIYALDKAGAELVARELGVASSTIKWKRKNRVDTLFMDHTLAVSEFYVNLVCLIRRMPDTRLVFWKRESKELQDRVSDPEGKRKYLTIAPDAFFCVETPQGKSYFFLEADMGTTTLGRFRNKIIAYRQYWKTGKFTEKHGYKGFRVITIAEGEKRLENLERVTREAGGRNMFIFLKQDSEVLNSDDLFWV